MDAPNTESTVWQNVNNVPGYPLPNRPITPTELFEVTKDGTVRRTVDGNGERIHHLSPSELSELSRLTPDSRTTETDAPLDAACVVLTIYSKKCAAN